MNKSLLKQGMVMAVLLSASAVTSPMYGDIPADSPEISEMVLSSYPAMDVPYTLADVSTGACAFSLMLDNFDVTVNPECTEPMTLVYESAAVPMRAIYAYDDFYDDGRYVMVSETNRRNVLICFEYDPQAKKPVAITNPGTYHVHIPDGYFLYGGTQEVRGATLTYILDGTPQPIEPVKLTDILTEIEPTPGLSITPEGESDGMGLVVIDVSGYIAINDACRDAITLTMEGMEGPIATIPVAESERGDAYVELAPQRSATEISLHFGETPILAAGHYTLTIPDGYFYDNGAEVLGADFDFYLNNNIESVGDLEIDTDRQPQIYRLDGVKQTEATDGIYIIDGKKVIVRT